MAEHSRLERARRYALSLPDASEAPHFAYGSWRVRGKIFATVPPEGDRLHLFVGEVDREWALALCPEAVEKLWWGKKVVGLRAWLDRTEAEMVEDLLRRAWRAKAPKSLLGAVQ